MSQRNIIVDRTAGSGVDSPFYIVTGSIGPYFTPKRYDTYKAAQDYAREICAFGASNNIWPGFKPYIEPRTSSI